jgi:uncharacterized protein (DUF1697 family)
MQDVRTLLQSGNVVFRSSAAPDALEKTLQAAIAKELGVDVEFFVRTRHRVGRAHRGESVP